MSNFGITAPMPPFIAVPKVSFTCIKTAVFGAAPATSNNSFWLAKASPKNHARRREVAKHKLVALLGDLRGGRNIDDVRNALLFRDLGDRSALARIESANQDLRPIADHFLGARARNVDIGLSVAVHYLQRRHAKILEDTWCDVDAALAVLADTRLKARTWQQDTDFQGGVLGAYNIEGGDSGDSACAQACSHGAS